MGKISLTFEELTAAFESWWTDYKADPTRMIDYDAEGYNDENYARDSATELLKRINKVQGE